MTDRRYRTAKSGHGARRIVARPPDRNEKPHFAVVLSQDEPPENPLPALAPLGPSPDF